MRHSIRPFILCAFALSFSASSMAEAARWVLYDDFSAGRIKTSRWAISGNRTQATISVVNEQLVFERTPGAEGQAALSIRINPDKVKGIRATVTASECNGNLVGAMQGLMGTYARGQTQSITLRILPQARRADGWVSIERRTATGDYDRFVRNVVTHTLGDKKRFAGIKKRVQITWTATAASWSVNNEGSISHKLARRLQSTASNVFPYHALVVSGTANAAGCRVVFDDVYVLI